MNEKIKQLAKQVPNWNCNGVFLGPYEKSLEKFAELIIKECMRVGFNAVATIDDGCYAVDVYNNIKEHFGVK